MNKINPLYILALCFSIAIYSILNLKTTNEQLETIKDQNNKYLILATKYNSLNKAWGDSRDIQKVCEKILKVSRIKSSKITKNGLTMKISIEELTKKQLDMFINKILNETITIIRFSFTKNSLEMEVGL